MAQISLDKERIAAFCQENHIRRLALVKDIEIIRLAGDCHGTGEISRN